MKPLLGLICLLMCLAAPQTAFARSQRLPVERNSDNRDRTSDDGSSRTIRFNQGSSRFGGFSSENDDTSYNPTSNPTRVRADERCEVTCNSGKDVQVDLTNRCMCIPGKPCFLIDIGTKGPGMTYKGNGHLGQANGAKYQTKSPAATSKAYDNDAMATGIPGNDKVGIWVHKTRGCKPGGGKDTKGCIAVPCQHWLDVKAQMGKSLTICNGNPSKATSMRKGKSSGTD